MNKIAERLYNGIVKENPTFVLTLGMCPTQHPQKTDWAWDLPQWWC